MDLEDVLRKAERDCRREATEAEINELTEAIRTAKHIQRAIHPRPPLDISYTAGRFVCLDLPQGFYVEIQVGICPGITIQHKNDNKIYHEAGSITDLLDYIAKLPK